MKKLTASEIRNMFLTFFKTKEHQIYPSKSLIPVDDPTLLWINSGVATLKKYFDGRLIPENPRIANSQKSIRTNDIENVGVTARHHTFFEMLGNFSIGDYFKKEAIEYAWELLTSEKWFGLDKSRLYITIYPDDQEAYDLWLKVGVEPTHIYKLKDNYWEIGEGPAGPNTEIYYDFGEEYNFDTPKEELYPGGENERYLEIWNIVFSQYNAKEGLKREDYPELPSKNIDTGMGLERITSVLQNCYSNYNTDLFLPIIKEIEKISGKKYNEESDDKVSFRVIADHIRACTFAICDGALPANDGRGYVIRRLIRRAIRYARKLGITKTFMKDLVPVVSKIMGDYYPELYTKEDFIKQIIEKEEEKFHETLSEGLNILSEVMRNNQDKLIDGKTAFKLYDTYGFPIDLTKEYAEEAGFAVDIEGFNDELELQRKRAREAREDVDSMQSQNETLMKITDKSIFVGYENLEVKGKVLYIINKDKLIDEAHEGDEVHFIFDKTPFYAESGGQVADTGFILNENVRIIVNDVTKAPNNQHLHLCTVFSGSVKVGDTVTLKVNRFRRDLITRNHTATHLLHKALKIVLGEHIAQAGSYVSSDRLRFDFNHYEAITKEQLTEIEQIVNQRILESLNVTYQEMPIEEAKSMGAIALFDEKYADIVRVVSCENFSSELCGGCHVNNTSEIGLFKIIYEGSIGAGVRRIEALTSEKAIEYTQNIINSLENLAALLKTTPQEVTNKVIKLLEDNKKLTKEIESLNQKLANMEAGDLVNQTNEINGYRVLVAKLNNIEINALRNMVDNFKAQLKSVVVVLANITNDKVIFMSGVTEDYVNKGVHAGELVKELAQICGGNGGGRKDFAQAGANNTENIDKAFSFLEKYLKNK